MQVLSKTTLSEFLDDRVVYRNLSPYDERLPSLDAVRSEIGLPAGKIPRKSEPEYGEVVAYFLRVTRQLESPGKAIEKVIYVGDTQMLDGTAFVNICKAGGWRGLAFIASEKDDAPAYQVMDKADGIQIFQANRWAMLDDFDTYCRENGFVIDDTTAVVIDMDKTMVGARGRNAHVIDRVRVEAVEQTVSGLLGAGFDPAAFRRAYQTLNQVEFHSFTADNQDYLAYICLILGSGLYDLSDVTRWVREGKLSSFTDFIAQVDKDKAALNSELVGIHQEILQNVQAGDPTPFKAFRRREYLVTVSHMGNLGDGDALQRYLDEEILITGEVREQALKWKAQGALIFGVSDKPDEASIPTQSQAAQGYQPIHRTATHVLRA